MSDTKASGLTFGADTYEGAFEEEKESDHESDGAIAEGDHFSLCSDGTVELDGITDDVEGRLYSVDPIDVEVDSVENSTQMQNNPEKTNGLQSDSDSEIDDDMKPIPKGKINCSQPHAQEDCLYFIRFRAWRGIMWNSTIILSIIQNAQR